MVKNPYATSQGAMEFGVRYWQRFKQFRDLELQLFDSLRPMSEEAWRLLPELEQTYACKAYFACISIACAIVEIELRRTFGMKGKLSRMLRRLGMEKDVGWMLELRNDVMHGNRNRNIQYQCGSDDELEAEWDTLCKKAFVVMHTLSAELESNRRTHKA